MTRRILALDMALNTGVACNLPHLAAYTWNLGTGKGYGAARSVEPAVQLQRCLTAEHATDRIDHVIFEGAISRQGPSIWIQNSLQTALMLWCVDHNVSFRRLKPSEWMYECFSKGHVERGDYHHRAREKWTSMDIETDDEAAALWLLHCEEKLNFAV